MSKWKKFILEQVLFEQDMSKKKVGIQKLNDLFEYFHLSEELLSDDWFKFTPRIPKDPFNDGNLDFIEDDFTKRISLAPTIDDALEAVFKPVKYVYGIDLTTTKKDDIPTVNLSDIDINLPVNYAYSSDTELKKFIGYHLEENPLGLKGKTKKKLEQLYIAPDNIGPSDLPPTLKKHWKYAVPDADETNEHWSLKPVKMLFIGELSGNKVRLSAEAVEFFERNNIQV